MLVVGARHVLALFARSPFQLGCTFQTGVDWARGLLDARVPLAGWCLLRWDVRHGHTSAARDTGALGRPHMVSSGIAQLDAHLLEGI